MAKKRKELTVEQLENLTRGHGKKYVSLDEGAALYSIGKNTFRQMAKDAKATYTINRRVLVNIQKFDEFMEQSLCFISDCRDSGRYGCIEEEGNCLSCRP